MNIIECECCGMGFRTHGCRCVEEIFCRACNHCLKHCKCPEEKRELDVPLAEQLAIAKYELARVGGRA